MPEIPCIRILYTRFHNFIYILAGADNGFSLLKRDKGFLAFPSTRTVNTNDEIVLKNIISMARDLGIDVVTEGVERPDQIDLLKNVGCGIAQGFLYDNPMPVADFQKRLEKGGYDE